MYSQLHKTKFFFIDCGFSYPGNLDSFFVCISFVFCPILYNRHFLATGLG